MASPDGISQWLPDTLPEDFSEWDSESSRTAGPGKSGGLESAHSSGDTPKSHGQSADRAATITPTADRSRDAHSAPSAPVLLKKQKLTSDSVDGSRGRASQRPEARPQWDSKASPAAPGNAGGLGDAHSFGETPKPRPRFAERDAVLSPAVDKPRDARSASSAPVFPMQQGLTSELVDELRSRASHRPAASREWDSNASPAAAPGNSSGPESAHSFGETPRPLGKSAEREAASSPVEEKPLDTQSAASAPILTKRQELMSELVDVSRSRASQKPAARPQWDSQASSAAVLPGQQEPASEPANGPASHALQGLKASATATEVSAKSSWSDVAVVDGIPGSRELTTTEMREADEALYQLFSSKNLEVVEEQKTSKKKWMIVAAVGACSIVLLVVIAIVLFHHGTKPLAKHSNQLGAEAANTQLETNLPKPSASEVSPQDKPLAASTLQQTSNNQPGNEAEAVSSARTLSDSQTQMMNDQLNAPTRIPQGIKNQGAENEPPPPSLGAIAADGLGGGTTSSVFNSHAQPVVKAAPSKPLAISAGVAVGMLVHQTAPVYPPIAKAARVSGTVELQATISKTGTITDLHVVSGPAMLRQPAIDAVRTWRYKPYKLNNEPTEVETTINVNFTLGG